jgi:uncharacterized protein YggT (Ycf19 family)
MQSLSNFLSSLIQIYTLLIIAAVLLTWFRLPHSPVLSSIRNFIESVTLPYLRLFRRFVPPLGGLDLSPIVAVFALQIVGGLAVAAIAGG